MAKIAGATISIERARSMGPCVRRDDVSKKRSWIVDLIRVLRNRELCPGPRHRVDKAVPGVGMPLAARFQHMAQQKKPRQRKAIAQVLLGPAGGCAILALAQKCRQ